MSNSRPVYSTDGGRIAAPVVRPKQRAPRQSGPSVPNDGVVRIFRERAHRVGKTVTVVRGLPERGAQLSDRLAELKRLCGAGGTLRHGSVEIQGDHRERLAEHLRSLGYTVKLAGG